MTTTAIPELVARRHAARVFDPAHRAALVARLRDLHDEVSAVEGGLHVAADDRGLELSTSTASQLGLTAACLRDLADAVEAGNWFQRAEPKLAEVTVLPEPTRIDRRDADWDLAWSCGYDAGREAAVA